MKQHFKILDGLRGIAAFSVVIFHATGSVLMPHAYLAVDFFFMLSGFVIGYAYDDRLSSIGILEFLKVRLIRLQPLAILGTIIGIFCFFLNPFAVNTPNLPFFNLLIIILISLFVLPTQSPSGKWYLLYPFNSANWSLFSEYFINIVYALIGSRISLKGLKLLVGIAALMILVTAIKIGNIHGGWSFQTIWIIPIRVTFPFFMGVLLFRLRYKIAIKFSFQILSLVLLVIFNVPSFRNATFSGLYDASMVILVFPLIVILAQGSIINKYFSNICDFFGKISYPIYVLHLPLVGIYENWVHSSNVSRMVHLGVGVLVFIFLIFLSFFLLRFFDEPIRKKLNSRYPIKYKN